MGGGVSVVYRHPHIQAAAVEMKSSSATTDRLVVKLSTKRAGRINLAAVYHPPSSSSVSTLVGSFCTEFADFLDELLLLPGHRIVCGDFNCPVETPLALISSSAICSNHVTSLRQSASRRTTMVMFSTY